MTRPNVSRGSKDGSAANVPHHHPSLDQLTSYACGDVSSGDKETLRNHLADCSMCQLYVQSMKKAFQAKQNENQSIQIPEISTQPLQPKRLRVQMWVWAVVAAVFSMGVILGTWINKQDHNLMIPSQLVTFDHRGDRALLQISRSPESGEKKISEGMALLNIPWVKARDGSLEKVEIYSQRENRVLLKNMKPDLTEAGLMILVPEFPDGAYEIKVYSGSMDQAGETKIFAFDIKSKQ